ncbi:lipase family protein [Sphingopyxis sp. PET50]|uniref:lipase family protein n=1 Tax=Sphingopyxis sp. PET50 TaxID=2976533 RepID=UPI0021AFAA25|nr:lipase family protein [Sphingopyxis sp. PET50]
MTLVGAAAAAPPTDLAANLREGSDKNARALLLSFALHSWSELYGFPLDAIANRTNQGIIHRLAQNNCVSLEKKPRLGTILGIVTVARATKNKDIATIEPFGSFARANSVDPARVQGPLLIAQGDRDTIVAPAVTRTFARSACRNRTKIRWVEMRGTEHGTSAKDSVAETLAWIGARFAGEAPPDDCRARSSASVEYAGIDRSLAGQPRNRVGAEQADYRGDRERGGKQCPEQPHSAQAVGIEERGDRR